MLIHNAILWVLGAILSLANMSLGSLLSQDIPCGPMLYCHPKNNDVWLLGTVQYLRWDSQFPPLTDKVDIRLFDMSNTSFPIMEWLQYNNDGFLSITLTRDYFPIVKPVDTVPRRWIKLVISWDGKPRGENAPIFAIEDIPERRPTVSTIIATATAKVTVTLRTIAKTTNKSSEKTTAMVMATATALATNRPIVYEIHSSKSYSAGKIAGIVIGSILAAALLGGVVIFAIRRNREQSPVLINPNEGSDVAMSSPDRSATGSTSGGNVQISPLTENEAYLIADTYRQSLRKPGWEDEPNLLL